MSKSQILIKKQKTVLSLILLFALVFPVIVATNFLQAGHAVDPKVTTYTNVQIVETIDGTGHGTSSQTFINSQNGYRVGDNTPSDGIVSSGDYVTVKTKLSFTAAKERTIRVSADVTQAPFFKLTATGGWCESGRIVTAKLNSDNSCSYTIPTGAVETLTVPMVFVALDTSGQVQEKQKIQITTERVGLAGSMSSYPVRDLTVVSAPLADVVLDNGGYSARDKSSIERIHEFAENSTKPVTGYLDVLAEKAVHASASTSHGSSSSGSYTAKVDVSKLPAGTTYTITRDGATSAASPSGGVITITDVSGDVRLNYSIPASVYSSVPVDTVSSYDVHVDVNKEAFSSSADLLNNGVGYDPGSNLGKDVAKGSETVTPAQSYPYANNNWSRVVVEKVKVPNGKIFNKSIYKQRIPSGKTIFDDEALSITGDTQYIYYTNKNVAQGTEIETVMYSLAENMVDGVAANTQVVFEDTWTAAQQQWVGHVDVTQGDRTLYPYVDYTYEYQKNGQWISATPSDNNPSISGVRVKINAASVTTGAGAGKISVSFKTKAVADPSNGSVVVPDTGVLRYTNRSNTNMVATMSKSFIVVAPPTPSGEQKFEQKITTSGGAEVDPIAAGPGNKVTYTVTPKVANIVRSSDTVKPTVEVTVPNIVDIANMNTQWNMTQQTLSNGYKKLVFTYNADGGVAPVTLNADGEATLPRIVVEGRIANVSTGASTATSTFTYVYNGSRNVTTQSQTQSYTVLSTDAESAIIRAKNEKVDIGDKFTFTFDIYARGNGRTGTATTVIRLPGSGDNAMTGTNNTGLDGSWNEYDLGSSSYHGSWRLNEPVVFNNENSTANSTVMYSTTNVFTDNAASYTWKTWGQLTDADKNNVKALKVVSTFTGSSQGNVPVTSAAGEFTITPNGNVKDDAYLAWIGRTDFSDGHADGALPFPAKTVVTSGVIAGTVFWDDNSNAFKDDAENKIGGVSVSLYAADANGSATGNVLKTVKTDANGAYTFDNLHSGDYVVVVKRNTGTTTTDGVQTQTRTYFNQLKDVVSTISWNKYGENAGNDSGRIALNVGGNIGNVDFGFYKPDPKATLNKALTDMSCDDAECVVKWDVTVENTTKNLGKKVYEPAKQTFDADAWFSSENNFTFINENNKIVSCSESNPCAETDVLDIEGYANTYTSVLHLDNSGIDVWGAIDTDGKIHIWGAGTYGFANSSGLAEIFMPDKKFKKAVFYSDGQSFSGAALVALTDDGEVYYSGHISNGAQSFACTPTNSFDTNGQAVKINIATKVADLGWDDNRNLVLLGFKENSNKLSVIDCANGIAEDAPEFEPEGFNVSGTEALRNYTMVSNLANIQAGVGKYGLDGKKVYLTKDGKLSVGKTLESSTVVATNVKTFASSEEVYFSSFLNKVLYLDNDNKLHIYNTETNTITDLDTGSFTVKEPTPIKFYDAPAESANTLPAGSILNDRMSDVVKDVNVTAGVENLLSGVKVREVVADGYSAYAITTNGDLYSWGYNVWGQLGLGDTTIRTTPAKVMSNVSKVVADDDSVYAITTNGDLYSWGRNSYGKLGRGDVITGFNTPAKVMSNVSKVVADDDSVYAITTNGDLYSWGLNNIGQLGLGSGDAAIRNTPAKVMSNVSEVDSSGAYTYAITTNGDLYSWGHNYYGQLGVGDSTNRNTPTKVMSGVSEVYASSFAAYAITTNGDLYSWGRNNEGQLGVGDSTNRNTPTKVMSGVSKVYAREKEGISAYAIATNGDLYSWGNNIYGRLGVGDTTDRNMPTKVMSDVRKVYASDGDGSSAYAITTNGDLYSWGRNNYCQLGTGDYTSRYTPTKVNFPAPTDPTAVPVEPISTTTSDNLTTRVYETPFDVLPGGKIVFHFTGRIPKTDADQIISNQSWFSSEDTPYAGTPHARAANVTSPTVADTAHFNETSLDISENATCRTGSDHFLAEMEHYFTSGNEDLCDQVGVRVPAYTTPPTWGSISGLMWRDTNSDGMRQSTETERIANHKVFLLDSSDNVVSTTTTNENGEYVFDTLKLGSYKVMFNRPTESGFTRYTYSNTDKTTNSDAQISSQNIYGVTPTLTLSTSVRNQTNIDAGVKPVYTTSIKLEKGTLENGVIKHSAYRERNNPIEVTFKVTNTGTEKLMDITLADVTTVGRDSVQNIQCPFRSEYVSGTSRKVLNPNETVSCTGTLIVRDLSSRGVPAHTDEATVTGVGVDTLKTVTDSSSFSVVTTADVTHGEEPSTPVDKLPSTGSFVVLFIIAGAVTAGAVGVRTMRKND